MPIINVTKDSVIAQAFGKARTPSEQMWGLMFKAVEPLVFYFSPPQQVHLHSWFCRAMDLVFLNDEWEVVELHREWRPWRTYRSRAKVAYLLELPLGSIYRSQTAIGDIVHLQ